ncbi:Crinkler (CRN) family protein, partial [Thraustotheca clavata]
EDGFNKDELKNYQDKGQLIRENHQEYCIKIFSKIDQIYTEFVREYRSICFFWVFWYWQIATRVCFRRQPYYYWLSTPVGVVSQSAYKCFSSISRAFRYVVERDNPADEIEGDIVFELSDFYRNRDLWTYGLIVALLEHASSDKYQNAREIIRLDEKTILNVKRCNLKYVHAAIEKMRNEKKLLPFFILDEMDLTTILVVLCQFSNIIFFLFANYLL